MNTCITFNEMDANLQTTLSSNVFHVTCKEGQFYAADLMANNQFNTFSFNLNVQYVNGMTPFDFIKMSI